MCFFAHLGTLQLASHLGIHEYDGVRYEFPDDVEYKFHFGSVGRVLTPLARERLTEFAIMGGVDYMLHIDSDMIVPMDMFEKLIRHKVDIVAPLAFMRRAPHYPVIYSIDEGWDSQKKMEYYVCNNIKNYPKNKLVECDAVGFGAALIDMKVVKKMKKPFFMSTTSAGEDIWFCSKAKRIGAKVFMDTSIQLGHVVDPQVVWEKDYEREFEVEKMRKTHGDWKGNVLI